MRYRNFPADGTMGPMKEEPAKTMAPHDVRAFMTAAHRCAMAELDNGLYIQRELPNVRMAEPLRAAAVELCSRLIGTKHDIVHELFEMEDLIEGKAATGQLSARMEFIDGRIWDDILAMHQLVQALQAASRDDPASSLACLLVTESAMNIIDAFKPVSQLAGRTNRHDKHHA